MLLNVKHIKERLDQKNLQEITRKYKPNLRKQRWTSRATKETSQ